MNVMIHRVSPFFHIIIKIHRRVRQGELPKGQKKVPWGTTSAHHI